MSAAPAGAAARPAVSPTAALLVAVVAVSWAGPLIRLTAAPAIAVSAWRLVLSVCIIGIILVVRKPPLARLDTRDWALGVAAGVFLALHFWTWIASLSLTTVSSSVVLVSAQPAFVAVLSALLLREPASARQWLGIIVAVGGAALIGWGDFGRGRTALLGDALALTGAFFVSCYYVIGRRLRLRLELWWYIFIVYGVAALVLLGVTVALPDARVFGYGRTDWLIFLLLAAVPTMLGHTGVNYALRYVRAYIANLALLAEPIGATLIAWALPAIREVPGPQTIAGGLLILTGVLLTLTGSTEGQ